MKLNYTCGGLLFQEGNCLWSLLWCPLKCSARNTKIEMRWALPTEYNILSCFWKKHLLRGNLSNFSYG